MLKLLKFKKEFNCSKTKTPYWNIKTDSKKNQNIIFYTAMWLDTLIFYHNNIEKDWIKYNPTLKQSK